MPSGQQPPGQQPPAQEPPAQQAPEQEPPAQQAPEQQAPEQQEPSGHTGPWPSPAAAPGSPGAGLPVTGRPTGLVAVAALAILLVGAGLVVVSAQLAGGRLTDGRPLRATQWLAARIRR